MRAWDIQTTMSTWEGKGLTATEVPGGRCLWKIQRLEEGTGP